MKNVKSTILTAGFVLAMALTLSCSEAQAADNRTTVVQTSQALFPWGL
jgi:hypothetical protein